MSEKKLLWIILGLLFSAIIVLYFIVSPMVQRRTIEVQVNEQIIAEKLAQHRQNTKGFCYDYFQNNSAAYIDCYDNIPFDTDFSYLKKILDRAILEGASYCEKLFGPEVERIRKDEECRH